LEEVEGSSGRRERETRAAERAMFYYSRERHRALCKGVLDRFLYRAQVDAYVAAAAVEGAAARLTRCRPPHTRLTPHPLPLLWPEAWAWPRALSATWTAAWVVSPSTPAPVSAPVSVYASARFWQLTGRLAATDTATINSRHPHRRHRRRHRHRRRCFEGHPPQHTPWRSWSQPPGPTRAWAAHPFLVLVCRAPSHAYISTLFLVAVTWPEIRG
jgi:hypothetical protein